MACLRASWLSGAYIDERSEYPCSCWFPEVVFGAVSYPFLSRHPLHSVE
jgi:hypothetical protein